MTDEMTAATSRLGPSPVRTRPSEPEELSLVPGTVLFQQWLLVRELGRGGFGAVFEARELNLDQIQAVKVLYPSMVTRAESLERFRREVRTMRSLSHAHIGRVFDYREDRDQDLALISMELVAGGTVRQLLDAARERDQAVPLKLAWSIFEQVLQALAEAHRQNVIHRDVAPGNVLLSGGSPEDLIAASTPDPGVKLVDFGIAGLLDTRDATGERTLSGRGLGTVAYMAPEVLASEEVTAAADVYGVGAVVYELLTGEPPLGRFEVPSRLRPSVSKAFDRLLLDCLDRRPERRPSAGEALACCRRWTRPGATLDDEEETRTGSVPLVGNGGDPSGDGEEGWVSDVVLAGASAEKPASAPAAGDAERPPAAKVAAWGPAGRIAAAAAIFVLALALGALLRDLWIRGSEPTEVASLEDPEEHPEGTSPDGTARPQDRKPEAETRPASLPPPDARAREAGLGGSERERLRGAADPAGVRGNGGASRGTPVAGIDGPPGSNGHQRPPAREPAVLKVDSSPPQAFVYLGGEFVGRAPLTTTVPAGRHVVRVLSPGCEGDRRRLAADAGGSYRFAFALDCSYETSRALSRGPLDGAPSTTRFAWHPIAGTGTPLIEDRLGMRFIYVPAGEFLMGSPSGEAGRSDDETQHRVFLTRPFWIGETEVTQEQWRRLMGRNPSHFLSCGADCPVDSVSWYEALEFANELSRASGFSECYRWTDCGDGGQECRSVRFAGLDCDGYRLPTEAEWEYAARGGTIGLQPAGQLDRAGWHRANSGECTHAVGRKAANPWGIRDMQGNVWEWVWDVWGWLPDGSVTDPLGPAEGSDSARVYRGGGYDSAASGAGRLEFRVASREQGLPAWRLPHVGFRLVRSAD